jgi:hypothetical protein
MTRNTQLLLTVLVTLLFGALFAVSPAAAENIDFNDQAAGDGTVTVENVSADGTPSVVVVTYESDGDRVVAAFSQTEAFADVDVTLQIADSRGIPGEHTASLIPVTGVSSETQNTGVLSDETSSNIVASETAMVGPNAGPQPEQSLDFNDQAAAGGAVTVENVSADGTPSVVAVTYESNGDRIVAGNSSVDTFVSEDVTVQIADDRAIPGDHTAHIIPASGISSESANTGILSDATIANITDNETATISEPRPNFQVSNIQPADATVPNGTVITISADIANTGTLGGTQGITLSIGGVSRTTTETLNAGESTTVTFSNVDTGALGPGSYTHEIASANDSATSSLTVQGPANFQVSNIQPADATVPNGTAIDVSADVENTGTVAGTKDITLNINTISRTKTETLNASESTTVTFTNVDTGALGPGSYTHEIASPDDSASGSLTVEPGGVFGLEFSAQGIENGNVTVENVVSGGVEAAVVVTYQNVSVGGTGLIVAGQSVGTFDGEDVQVTLDDTSALGGNYTAHILPASELSDSTETSGVVSSETAGAIEASQGAFVSVEVIDGQFARDTTGDGLLNNVRGSDGFNILDVQALFDNLGNPVLQNNVGAFDFQDDEGINILDVQALFNQLS